MKLISKINNPVLSAPIKLLLASLLLIAITACEGDKPETINSELDLNLPNSNHSTASSEIILTNNDDLPDSSVAIEAEEIEDTEIDTTTNSSQQYPLNPLYLKAKNLKLFTNKSSSSFLIEDKFYPLGWSADGEKIAYAITYEVEAAAMFFAGVYIQDLVSDKIIWGIEKKAEVEELNNLKTYWAENNEEIIQGLKKHGIVASQFTLKNPPISYANDQLNYRIKIQKVNDSNEIKAYQIFLSSKIKGHKEIAKTSLKIKGDRPGGKIKVAVIGYFQGSDQARVATLVGLLESGWEGSRLVRYKIIGASLKYGKWRK